MSLMSELSQSRERVTPTIKATLIKKYRKTDSKSKAKAVVDMPGKVDQSKVLAVLSFMFPDLVISVIKANHSSAIFTQIGVGITVKNNAPLQVNNIRSIINKPIQITKVVESRNGLVALTNRSANIMIVVGDRLLNHPRITTNMIIAACIHEVGHWVHINHHNYTDISKYIRFTSLLSGIGATTAIAAGTIAPMALGIIGITTALLSMYLQALSVYHSHKTEYLCDALVVRMKYQEHLKALLSVIGKSSSKDKSVMEKMEKYLLILQGYLVYSHPTLKNRIRNIQGYSKIEDTTSKYNQTSISIMGRAIKGLFNENYIISKPSERQIVMEMLKIDDRSGDIDA